ncbi:MAG: NAD(P)H-dependent oxidoreductase [Symplocastrum torsivum CPER-KK1]|jgi:FMN-dependent NADH-azoreductase|uniref:FMN dependent NADH:quinone oxidoreductase n=1 Tax=Symplocastrum torsivum CPER-KK1 TaxID=450513 RepID=A0A951PG96_9CYAN|nr:NAD(P)H-dependent oxidoreductase [Symplocastrum torsivum CPER-KK1]
MKLLEIQSSVRQEGSVSRTLASKFIHAWRSHQIDVKQILRDVGANPPKLPTAAWVVANYTPPQARTQEMRDELAESEMLIEELATAERIVLGVPMYNFSVPTNLKAYIDNVVRVDRTFSFDRSTGMFGSLLTGKKALIISSRAGGYAPGTPTAAIDFCEPYLRFILNFIGIEDVEYIEVPNQFGSSEERQQATETALERLMELAQTW